MPVELKEAVSIGAMISAGAAILTGSQSPRLDARVIAKHVLDCDDAALIAHSDTAAPVLVKEHFAELIMRRARGEPVSYITGVKEFWGLPFRVTPDVLIPRADSECLIEVVCKDTDRSARSRILDLGTGSGCLLCALLTELPEATGIGVDQSAGAVAIARENIDALGLADRAGCVVSDWFENVEGVFDVIVANAPYIPDGDRAGLIVDVSDYEPTLALFAGADGLDAYRRIFEAIGDYLARPGLFVLEYGDAVQGEKLRAMAARYLPEADISTIRDLAFRERGLAARLKV